MAPVLQSMSFPGADMISQRRAGGGRIPLILTLLLAGLTSLAGCGRAPDPWAKASGDGPRVLVSFPPLYCFTKNVAGDHARVISLLSTQEPHGYSPNLTEGLKARKADLFIINGLGLDD